MLLEHRDRCKPSSGSDFLGQILNSRRSKMALGVLSRAQTRPLNFSARLDDQTLNCPTEISPRIAKTRDGNARTIGSERHF